MKGNRGVLRHQFSFNESNKLFGKSFDTQQLKSLRVVPLKECRRLLKYFFIHQEREGLLLAPKNRAWHLSYV